MTERVSYGDMPIFFVLGHRQILKSELNVAGLIPKFYCFSFSRYQIWQCVLDSKTSTNLLVYALNIVPESRG